MENVEVANLKHLTTRICDKINEYLGSQLAGSLQSMELLKEVIDTINKNYIQMNKEFKSIGHVSKIMKLKASQLESKINNIDEIDEELTELEDMVDQLEKYTATLQTKFFEIS